MADKLTPAQRHKNMVAVKNKGTKPELILRMALWRKGLRYRKNYKGVPGVPDIAFVQKKIAVFVDGDFWHARGHQEHPGEEVASNQAFWKKKLSRNVERDREVNDALTELGWLVLRFWESDIKKDVDKCVEDISSYM